MLILSFGWTWPAVARRAKSVTRRQWSARQLALHQAAFDKGHGIQAWTKGPHAKGRAFGQIRYTQRPYLEPLGFMPDVDYVEEGFRFFNQNPWALPATASARPWAQDQCSLQAFRSWRDQERTAVMVVLRFEIIDLEPWISEELEKMRMTVEALERR